MFDRNLKNVVVVSVGFLSLFTAYAGLQSLQSSLNPEEGMGVASLSVIYASMIVASMFLPPIMNKNLGSAAINFSCIIALLYWRPHPDQLPVFLVFPGLWGVADAVWNTQTNSIYGVLFPRDKEAAFANLRVWQSLGAVVAFAYSTSICLETKLYILLAVLLLTVVTYPSVEYEEYKNPVMSIEASACESSDHENRRPSYIGPSDQSEESAKHITALSNL